MILIAILLTLVPIHLVVGAVTVSANTLVSAVVGAALAAGGVYGYVAKRKEEAATVWRDIAEAREAENRLFASQISELKARVDLLTSDWAKEVVREIIHLIERETKRQ